MTPRRSHPLLRSRGRGPWFRQHHVTALTVAGALYAGITGLRFAFSGQGNGIEVLFVLPVALLAVTYGRRGGFAGALVGMGLFTLWSATSAAGIDVLGLTTRSVALLLLGVLLGDATDRDIESARRAREQDVLLEHALEGQWRRREALELHDGVIQGLAAGIWMLDAGKPESALGALTSTLGIAEHIVSDLLGRGDVEPGDLVRSRSLPS